MRKLKFFLAAAILALCVSLCGGLRTEANAAVNQVYLGGMTAGFSLSNGGVEIIGLTEVVSDDGIHHPAEEAGIRVGDVLVAVDGIKVSTVEELSSALERSGGKETDFLVKRSGETAHVMISPVKDGKGKYKIGILIRDTLSGIGTITYIQKDTLRFGALGHAVCDESHDPLSIADPKVYLCSVIGVTKGKRGKAGELRGLFLNETPLAGADKVCETGLYGTFSEKYDFSRCEIVETASVNEASIGKAIIYSTVDGICPQKYEIAIAKVDAGNKEHKNFVIKITDDRLLEETGGIVQGMSGSPIVQNGKLIGAVTHVFVNDPTRGFGIAIENMLGN